MCMSGSRWRILSQHIWWSVVGPDILNFHCQDEEGWHMADILEGSENELLIQYLPLWKKQAKVEEKRRGQVGREKSRKWEDIATQRKRSKQQRTLISTDSFRHELLKTEIMCTIRLHLLSKRAQRTGGKRPNRAHTSPFISLQSSSISSALSSSETSPSSAFSSMLGGSFFP